MRVPYARAVEDSGVLEALAPFHPHIAGTLPLGIAVATSDIDVLCECPDPMAFTDAVVASLGDAYGFTISQWLTVPRPIVARFHFAGWEFEIYAQATPVAQQVGWRHFVVEQRLLDLGGERLREAIIAAKQAGLKTEPAFAHVLMLGGDPYEAVLDLALLDDAALQARLEQAGV